MDSKCIKCGNDNRNLFFLYAIQYQFNHLLNDLLTIEQNIPKLKALYNARQILSNVDNEIESIKKQLVNMSENETENETEKNEDLED